MKVVVLASCWRFGACTCVWGDCCVSWAELAVLPLYNKRVCWCNNMALASTSCTITQSQRPPCNTTLTTNQDKQPGEESKSSWQEGTQVLVCRATTNPCKFQVANNTPPAISHHHPASAVTRRRRSSCQKRHGQQERTKGACFDTAAVP